MRRTAQTFFAGLALAVLVGCAAGVRAGADAILTWFAVDAAKWLAGRCRRSRVMPAVALGRGRRGRLSRR